MKFTKYTTELNNALKESDEEMIENIFDVLRYIIENQGTTIICGNGGSFANSLHIAGDYHKTFASYKASFHAVGENYCSISAISNDFCYEEALSIHLTPLIKKKVPNLIIFLSGSGNSINLINAIEKINKDINNIDYVKTISLSAYGGGAISKLVNFPLVFNINDMEIAEDIQLIIFHFLKQKLIDLFPVKSENYTKYFKRIIKGDIV